MTKRRAWNLFWIMWCGTWACYDAWNHETPFMLFQLVLLLWFSFTATKERTWR